MVRVPDAAGQVGSAPVKALRGFFAGIGQLLVTADRFKAEEAEREQSEAAKPADPAEVTAETAGAAGKAVAARNAQPGLPSRENRAGRHRATGMQGPAASGQAPTRRFRSLDSTGNVRLLTPDDAETNQDEDLPAASVSAPAPVPAPRSGRAPGPEPAPGPAAGLPVPGYDELTIASLRSRLRYLDAGQLAVLVAYERAHASRPDVVGMFERRIAKLEAASRYGP